MADTQTFTKLIIEIDGVDYEMDAGGGGGQPGPNTVGTEQIIDGAVEMEDLHEDVVEKMTNTYDSGNRRLTLGNVVHTSTEESGASTAPTVPTQPIVVEEEEEP